MLQKFKFPFFIGSISLVIIVLLMLIIQTITKEEESFNLSNLIETPYEVLKIRKNSDPQPYEVILTGDLDYTDQILLATKIQKEISNVEKFKNRLINLHFYEPDINLKEVKDAMNYHHPGYRYTIELDGSNIIKYEPLELKNVVADVTASENWLISDSYFNEQQELIFTVNLAPDLEMDAIFSTLKGITEEMIRYNFKNSKNTIVKQEAILNENESLYYVSNDEDYLIQKTVLIGKGE